MSDINQDFDEDGGDQERYRALQDHWLPFFRRGCWLSCCRIEATAHEKAEWLNGLTHEEIETWHLKF